MEDSLRFDLETRQVTIHHAKLNCRNGLLFLVVVVVIIMIIMIRSGLTQPEVSLMVSLGFFCR